MKITDRTRYIIREKSTGKILCGTSRNSYFVEVDEIKHSPVRTYDGIKRAKRAIHFFCGDDLYGELEVVKVKEIIEVLPI